MMKTVTPVTTTSTNPPMALPTMTDNSPANGESDIKSVVCAVGVIELLAGATEVVVDVAMAAAGSNGGEEH